MSWTAVSPTRAAAANPAARSERSSDRVGLGTATCSMAASISRPVGAPPSSRTMHPPAGSVLPRATPPERQGPRADPEGVAIGPGQGNGPPRRDALEGAGVGVVGAGPAVLVPTATDEPRGLGQLTVAFGDAKQDLVERGRARQVELPLSGSHAVEVQVRVDQARQDHGAIEIDRVAPGGTLPDRGHHAALEADAGDVRP